MSDLSDMRRLTSRNDLGATLLRSAKEDRVPEGAASRAISAAMLATAAATAPAAGTSLLHRLGVIAKAPAAKLTYLAVSVVLAGGAIATSVSSSGPNADVAGVAASSPRAFATTRVSAAPEVRTPDSNNVPSLRVEDLPQASVSVSASSPSPSPLQTSATTVPTLAPEAPSATPTIDSSLAEEVQALDGVRSSLRAGDANGALAKLTAYEAKFPKKQLSREAAVLRSRAVQLRDGTSVAP